MPNNIKLSLRKDSIEISPNNTIVDGLNEAVGNISSVIKDVSVLKETISTFITSITPQQGGIPLDRFKDESKAPEDKTKAGHLSPQAYQANVRPFARKLTESNPFNGSSWINDSATTFVQLFETAALAREGTPPTGKKQPVDYVEKDGYIYYLTDGWKVDKALILAQHVYYLGVKLPPGLIDEFMRTNRYNNVVDYTDEDMVTAKVDLLFENFDSYLKKVAESRKFYQDVSTKIKPDMIFLKQLLSIADRSLPSKKVDRLPIQEKSAYRSYSFPLGMSANKKFTYTISQKHTTGDTATSLTIFQDHVHVGKWQLFDVSAGIAFTIPHYDNRVIKSRDKPQEIENQNGRVAPIAGLHIYPWRIYRRDERFAFRKGVFEHRISLYLGVNFIKPLEHFYPGIGIDLIPGIK